MAADITVTVRVRMRFGPLSWMMLYLWAAWLEAAVSLGLCTAEWALELFAAAAGSQVIVQVWRSGRWVDLASEELQK